MTRRAPSRLRLSSLLCKVVCASLVAVALPIAMAVAAGHHHASPMTDADMERWVTEWYRTHPMRGVASTGVPAATFNATGFQFDLDNNAATLVDTAKIVVGETVLWHRVDGSHTTTNGLTSEDPNAGLLWDQGLTLVSPNFTFQFDIPGEYPFFCRPHEFDEMKGVVVVKQVAGVGPGGGSRLGFTNGPHPNPSRAGIAFGFALERAGRVTAELFDARGRRVAVAVDRDFDPGEHAGSWDGRVASGTRAPSGIYYLRLRLPGYVATRQLSLTR